MQVRTRLSIGRVIAIDTEIKTGLSGTVSIPAFFRVRSMDIANGLQQTNSPLHFYAFGDIGNVRPKRILGAWSRGHRRKKTALFHFRGLA